MYEWLSLDLCITYITTHSSLTQDPSPGSWLASALCSLYLGQFLPLCSNCMPYLSSGVLHTLLKLHRTLLQSSHRGTFSRHSGVSSAALASEKVFLTIHSGLQLISFQHYLKWPCIVFGNLLMSIIPITMQPPAEEALNLVSAVSTAPRTVHVTKGSTYA